MRELTFAPAVGGDVAIRDNRVHLTFGHEPWTWLQLDLDGNLVEKRTQPRAYYPKTNGITSVGHDGERFLAWTLPQDVVVQAGTPVGNNAAGISDNGTLFFARKLPDGSAAFFCDGTRLENEWASNGLWECRDDCTARTFDDVYYAPRPPGWGGLSYHEPSGTVAVCEGSQGGVVGTVRGVDFAIWRGLEARWPRVATDGTHVAIVAWGMPGPTVRLWIGTLDELAGQVQPEVVLPAVPARLAGRSLWYGYYFAISNRESVGGDNLDAPGNCTVVLEESEAQRSPWPYYAPPGVGEGPRKIADMVSISATDPVPSGLTPGTMCLYDGGSRLPDSPCGEVTGLEMYSDPGESVASCEARMRAWLSRFPTAKVVLVAQSYDRNGLETDEQKLADLQAIPLRLAVDFPQIGGILMFSDGRKGGTRDHEIWRPLHAAAAAMIRSPWAGDAPMPEWELAEVLSRYVARFAVPQMSGGEAMEVFEERCRQWSIRFAEQVAYERPRQGYGMKRAAHDRPIGKDTIARRVGDATYAWDLLLGAASGSPTLIANPATQDISAQVFVPVVAQNHLAVVPPTPEAEPETLAAAVRRMEAVLPIYGARIRAIEAALRAIGQAMPT